MIEKEVIECSSKDILDKITNSWYEFDDDYIVHNIRKCLNGSDDELKIKSYSLLFRKIPKLVYEYEFF